MDTLGGRTSFTYDAAGNRLSITDANTHTTTFIYDAMNRQLTETDPLSRARFTAYDAAGRVASTTDAKGQTIIYNYDNANRLISKKYPDNSTGTYTYDNNGNLTKAINTAVTMSYTYDKRNLLLSIKNETINKTVGYAYDAAGQKVSLTYPDGETLIYTRDQRGHVSTLSTNQPGALTNQIVSYDYTPSGALSTMDYSFGMHVARTYDSTTSRLTDLKYTKLDNTIIADFAYTHDTIGNILAKTTDYGTITYGYDSLNRLTSAQYSWKPAETFTYDAVGDRLTNVDYNSWSYDNANQLLSYGNGFSAAFTFTYDANGSTVSKTDTANNQTTQYLYNFDNLMSEAQQGSSTIAKYFNDHKSHRVRKDLYINGLLSSTTWFVYGQEGLLVEYDNAGTLIKKYTWQPDRPWGTDPAYQQDLSGKKSFYINDHLPIPQKIVDTNFELLWQGAWESFGKVNPEVSFLENNLRLPGQNFDLDTGFYYNWHRDYDPGLGRYIEEDPIRFDRGVSLFSFTRDNPINLIDPQGLFSMEGDCCGFEKKIKRRVEQWCSGLDDEITDMDLRNCIKKRCDESTVKCVKNHSFCANPNNLGFNASIWFIRFNTAYLCVLNPKAVDFSGQIVIHEWAHSCGWDHGEGKGVPGDKGAVLH